MKILLEGLRKFNTDVYPQRRPLFEKLAKGQAPHTLMITCSDSRIDPNLVTQTDPGEIFVVRNAGNIIPPYGSSSVGEEASIEFAIDALQIRHIVVCGHSYCGAMAALLEPEKVKDLPAVGKWLQYAEATRRRCMEQTNLSPNRIVEENVLVQIDHLKTHPSVSVALRRNRVDIFGWFYHVDTCNVSVYDPRVQKFLPSSEVKERTEHDLSSLAI